MQLDEVLGLAALAIQHVVEPFGAAARDVGHDVRKRPLSAAALARAV
jgi:hypothetical protein